MTAVKTPVVPLPDISEIDRHLAVLSDMMKIASPDHKEMYIRKINKLLDQRNKVTHA
jgi:hypothetical protein